METAVTCVVSVNSKVHVPTCDMASSIQARSQHSDNGGGSFTFRQILDLFSWFENWSSQWPSRETSFFKLITTDDVTFWSKVESTW